MSAPYPPGQPQWPDNQPQRPDRPPPIRFHREEPPPRRNSPLDWALRIAGLVAVAVVSGLVWWYIQEDNSSRTPPPDDQAQQRTEGKYDFNELAQLRQPRVDSSCAEHSYGDIKDFFEATPCDRLTRSVFTTTVPDGRTVYVSVVVVLMANDQDAKDLREKTDTDSTGNVQDLLREGIVNVDGLDKLTNGGGYASTQVDREVVIVEADFAPDEPDRDAHEELLDDVCNDGRRLGTDITSDAG